MAWSLVQSKNGAPATSITSKAVTMDSAGTVGNWMFVCTCASTGAQQMGCNLSDTINDYFPIAISTTNTGQTVIIWAAKITTSATLTVTLTVANVATLGISASEWSGYPGITIKGHKSGVGTSTSPSSGTVNIDSSSDLLLGGLLIVPNSSNPAPTVGSGFSEIYGVAASSTLFGMGFEYQTGLGSDTAATWTLSGTTPQWGACGVSVQGASAGGVLTHPGMTGGINA